MSPVKTLGEDVLERLVSAAPNASLTPVQSGLFPRTPWPTGPGLKLEGCRSWRAGQVIFYREAQNSNGQGVITKDDYHRVFVGRRHNHWRDPDVSWFRYQLRDSKRIALAWSIRNRNWRLKTGEWRSTHASTGRRVGSSTVGNDTFKSLLSQRAYDIIADRIGGAGNPRHIG